VYYHANIVVTPATPTTSATIVFTVKSGATVVFTATSANMPNGGATYGMGTFVPNENYPDWEFVRVDNFNITGTGPAAATSNLQATTYLYTLVNDLGEESGPSPAMLNTDGSNTITRQIGQGVSVVLPGTLAASGADITYFQASPPASWTTASSTFIPPTQLDGLTPNPSMNLYRAVTGSSGTSFLLVKANIPFSGGANTTFVDQVPDTALSQVLQSLLWFPPPTNMLGILALPNGIYAGYERNNLCLSAQGVPHAWPLAFQLTFDYDIVGIGAIDATVVVLTKRHPYLCAGNTPDNYSQTKASYPYRCASKRSIQYLKNIGVVFATFEGIIAIASPGSERLLTEGLFTKREWQAMNPPSMIAAVNDNRYFCWFTPLSGPQGGFYLDLNEAGSGKISLGYHATARYSDPLSDSLFIVPDFFDPAIPIGVNLQFIATFDANPASPLPYVWKSKQFYLPYPTAYRLARVTADSYANTTLNLFADGTQYGGNIPVTSQYEFSLPQPPNGVIEKFFEFQVIGTDRIDRVQIVEDAEEFV
jgi:hypothetical protein